VSLTAHKRIFDNALRDAMQPEDLRRAWLRFAVALVEEYGGSSLSVPTTVRDPDAEQRQGELFEQRRAEGLSIREIAATAKCSKDRVHRHLSQSRIGTATAA